MLDIMRVFVTYKRQKKTCSKRYKILNICLFLLSNEMLVIRMTEIYKMLVNIANRADPDQTASTEVV